MEEFLVFTLVPLICFILGFLIGNYQSKIKQQKELEVWERNKHE